MRPGRQHLPVPRPGPCASPSSVRGQLPGCQHNSHMAQQQQQQQQQTHSSTAAPGLLGTDHCRRQRLSERACRLRASCSAGDGRCLRPGCWLRPASTLWSGCRLWTGSRLWPSGWLWAGCPASKPLGRSGDALTAHPVPGKHVPCWMLPAPAWQAWGLPVGLDLGIASAWHAHVPLDVMWHAQVPWMMHPLSMDHAWALMPSLLACRRSSLPQAACSGALLPAAAAALQPSLPRSRAQVGRRPRTVCIRMCTPADSPLPSLAMCGLPHSCPAQACCMWQDSCRR